MTDAKAGSEAEVANAQAQGSTGAATQFDMGTDRAKFTAHDVDKDTGADERYEEMSADAADLVSLNRKRTYDLYQSVDISKQLEMQGYESALRAQHLADIEQRRRHTEAEFNQRMRHADTSNAVVAALLGDMAEKLEYVVGKMDGPK